MNVRKFALLVSVILFIAVIGYRCSEDQGIHTSFRKEILSAKNDFLEMSLDISTGEIPSTKALGMGRTSYESGMRGVSIHHKIKLL